MSVGFICSFLRHWLRSASRFISTGCTFLKMFAGILPAAMYLVILIILFLLVFQGIEMFRKYQKQINILNYK